MSNLFFEIGHNLNNARADRPKVIFVEGTDDAYFLDSILESIGADPAKVGIVTVGGKGEFDAKLKGFSKTPNFTSGKVEAVLVVRDADDDFVRAQDDAKRPLKKIFGADLLHGNIAQVDGVSYGFFLMPGMDESGDLERLCLSTVSGEKLEQQANDFLAALDSKPADHFYKRKAQIYLAGFNGELCRGAGLGFKRGQFNPANAALGPLKDFLSRGLK